MPKTKKTILVTGGLGFIGSRFIKYVREVTNWKVICYDSMTYAADINRVAPESIEKSLGNIIIGDICGDITQHVDVDMVDYLVNFAAESHVDNSIKDGRPFLRSNVEGVLNLLETFKGKNLTKFVQISTDEVYGDMDDIRGDSASESFNIRPSSYYAATKASADLLVQSASRTFGIPYLITRSCNNFGPNQHREKFLPTVFNSIKEGKPVPVYGDGKQVREWIHTDDNVHFIFTLMLGETLTNEVFNIGSGFHYTNLEIIEMTSKYLGKEVKYEHVKDRLGHDRRYSLDCSKLHEYMPSSDWCTTLETFLMGECNAVSNRG